MDISHHDSAYREAARDVEYEGVKIPKGTVVVYPIRMMQMDPEVYPDPEKFIPERLVTLYPTLLIFCELEHC